MAHHPSHVTPAWAGSTWRHIVIAATRPARPSKLLTDLGCIAVQDFNVADAGAGAAQTGDAPVGPEAMDAEGAGAAAALTAGYRCV